MEKHDILIYDDLIRSIRQHVLQQNYLSLSQVVTLIREFSMFVQRWKEKLTIQIEETINLDLYWDANGHLMIQKLLNDQRAILLKIIQLQSNHEKVVNSIDEIARYIQINYEEDISLQEFSERFYLSREYISRKFKQMYGENISDYIVRIRIERAKELLKFPNLKIYEIANRIGYQDDKYFRKVFKKAVGITPSDYRKNFEEQSSNS
jgi:two-component system response regulator YesN